MVDISVDGTFFQDFILGDRYEAILSRKIITNTTESHVLPIVLEIQSTLPKLNLLGMKK